MNNIKSSKKRRNSFEWPSSSISEWRFGSEFGFVVSHEVVNVLLPPGAWRCDYKRSKEFISPKITNIMTIYNIAYS